MRILILKISFICSLHWQRNSITPWQFPMESRMQHKHEIYLARGGRSYTQAVTSTRGSSAGWSMRLAITCPASSKYISNRRARANLLNSNSYDDSAILQKSSPQTFLFKCEEYLSNTYFLPSFHYVCWFMAALSHRSQRCQKSKGALFKMHVLKKHPYLRGCLQQLNIRASKMDNFPTARHQGRRHY